MNCTLTIIKIKKKQTHTSTHWLLFSHWKGLWTWPAVGKRCKNERKISNANSNENKITFTDGRKAKSKWAGRAAVRQADSLSTDWQSDSHKKNSWNEMPSKQKLCEYEWLLPPTTLSRHKIVRAGGWKLDKWIVIDEWWMEWNRAVWYGRHSVSVKLLCYLYKKLRKAFMIVLRKHL